MGLVGLTLAMVYTELSGRLSGVRRIGPAQLTALINRDNALVVDLRPVADFDKGHIAGAKNVQMSQFDPENKQLAPAKALPVVLVCKVGESADDGRQAPAQGRFQQRQRARGRRAGLASRRPAAGQERPRLRPDRRCPRIFESFRDPGLATGHDCPKSGSTHRSVR